MQGSGSGLFGDGRQALSFCAAHGRTVSDRCIGRLLSHDGADFPFQCYPADGSLPSRCEN